MQAMPTTSVDPAGPGVPAGSKPQGKTASDGQFSQHLTAAGKNNKAGHQDSKETAVAAVKQSDKDIDSAQDLAQVAAEESQRIMATAQNQPVISPEFTGKALSSLVPGQDGQFLSLQNSIQIPGLSSGQPNNGLPTLESLSSQMTTTGNGRPSSAQITAGLNLAKEQTTALNGPQNSGQTDLTIENWRAQFRYHSTNEPQGAGRAQGNLGQTQNIGDVSGRDPVLAYTSPEIEAVTAPTRAKGGSGVEMAAQPRDANSNYIHSNLPGVSVQGGGQNGKGTQQQNGEGQKNLGQEKIASPEQTLAGKTGQDTPLIFSLDQDRNSGLMPQTQTTSNTQMLRLPSGSEISHSQIVNQVIDRFSLNRTLESGSITMKLHPAELGELRMEIKVEQDNIKAHITTQNPQVQEILDRHLPRLREALEQQGLNLEQMTVTVGTDDGSNSQLFQEHFNGQQSGPSLRSNNDQVAFSLDQELQDDEETVEGPQNLSVLI